MGKFKFEASVSLDGYMAGPDQTVEEPLGTGGEALHEWAVKLSEWREQHGKSEGETNPSSQVVAEMMDGVGAFIMGRNMFGGHPGSWDPDEPWTGWWGENPPYHRPVFVLTHHARETLEMEGGNVFHFVTEGPERALDLAREAAGDDDVLLMGGADVTRQYLALGELDEIRLNLVPILLGEGERPLDGVRDDSFRLELVELIQGPEAVHLRYAISRR